MQRHDETGSSSAEHAAELTIEGYAELLAHVGHFGDERLVEALAFLDVSEAMRASAAARWPAAMAAETLRGRRGLSDRFVAAFVRAAGALEACPPELGSVVAREDVQGASRPNEVARVPPALEPEPAREAPRPSVDRPSCLLGPAEPRAHGASRSPWESHAPAVAAWDESNDTTCTAAAVVRQPVLPFRASAPKPTLAQYASLFAELAVAPAAAEHVFARYGLAEPIERCELERTWGARFRSEPRLLEEFHALVARYQSWLASQHGGRT